MQGEAHPYEELLRRIDARRAAMGDISETQACYKAGLKKDCIRTIRRKSAPRAETLKALARALDTAPSYFLEAVGLADMITDESPETFDPDREMALGDVSPPPPGYVYVPALADLSGMGGPGPADGDNMRAPMLLPERLIRTELRGEPSQFVVIAVVGPSMSPVLESGDQVLVDRRQKNPAQPGIFVLYDGLGYVAKWVQHLPRTDPPRLKISSENSRFEPYEVTLDEAHIVGRVVWYARRL